MQGTWAGSRSRGLYTHCECVVKIAEQSDRTMHPSNSALNLAVPDSHSMSAIGFEACQQENRLVILLRSVHVLHLLLCRKVRTYVQPSRGCALASADAKVASNVYRAMRQFAEPLRANCFNYVRPGVGAEAIVVARVMDATSSGMHQHMAPCSSCKSYAYMHGISAVCHVKVCIVHCAMHAFDQQVRSSQTGVKRQLDYPC